jgi:molybdate transport system permease protein
MAATRRLVTAAVPNAVFRTLVLGGFGLATTIVLAVLVGQVGFVSAGDVLAALRSETVGRAVSLSVLCATIAAGLALFVAVPAAYVLARHRFVGSTVIDALLDIPMIMSPVALGLALLLLFRTGLGQWVETHLVRFVFEVPGIVFAQFMLALALETRVLKATFEAIDVRYEHVSRCFGYSAGATFLRVTLPLARPGLLAALVLGWARAIGDFGATVMIAGAVPGKTETVPVAVYLSLASLRLEQAVVLTLLLTVTATAALILLRLLGGER